MPKVKLKEEPLLLFERASVCLEILVDESYYDSFVIEKERSEEVLIKSMENYNNNTEYCDVTHSFETDLLAYSHQVKPPFYTRCFNFPLFSEVLVHFPQITSFVSEGRQESLYVTESEEENKNYQIFKLTNVNAEGEENEDIFKEIRLNVFLNYTYFYNSEIRIWHLVFTADEDHSIDEIDLIKLMKFFSGIQESKTYKHSNEDLGKIRFSEIDEPNQRFDIIELFNKISGVKYKKKNIYEDDNSISESVDIKDIRNGIVAIDADYCKFQNLDKEEEKEIKSMINQLFMNLTTNDEGKKISSVDVQRQYQSNVSAEYVFESFCGITLGIFDYNRMGFEEISDTLIPRSTTENSFLTINRGVLSSFAYGDDVMAASIKTIGINPYLQIPSAVLAHNEYVSNDAFNKSHLVLEHIRDTNSPINVRYLESARKQIRSLLNIDFLPNVFQYPTEQDLFEYGLLHRGILEKNDRTRRNLDQIDNVIDECNSNLDHKYQFWINILLMIISIFQIYEVVTKIIFEIGSFKQNYSSIVAKMSVLAFLIGICLFISFRLYRRSSLNTNKRFFIK